MTPQLGARYKLSAEQLRRYHRDGYVVVPEVFPVDELEAIDEEIERLLRQPGSQTVRAGRPAASTGWRGRATGWAVRRSWSTNRGSS
jgi:hypothetical protein